MISKSLSYLAIAFVTTTSIQSLTAGPRIAGGEVTLQASADITKTDRVAPNAISDSDTIYSVTPMLIYNRESNTMDLNGSFSYSIRRYDRAERLNSENIRFSFGGEVPFGANPKLTGNWNVGYFEGVQADFDRNTNRNTESLNLSTYANYALRGKWSLRARASYVDRDSTGVLLENQTFNSNHNTTYAFGVHARDLIRGRVGLYTEYVIRKRRTDQGQVNQNVDNKDEGLNFGITGQILPERLFPKLEADLSVGYTSSAGSDSFNSSSGRRNRVTINGRLAYPANNKTDVVFTYNKNLDVSSDDRTVERTSLNLSVNYTPRQRLSFNAGIGTQTNDFIYNTDPRKDDVFTANFTTSYQIRSFWSAAFSLNYRDSSSDRLVANYDTQRATLSSTLSF